MKKIVSLILIVCICFSFAACGKKAPTKEEMLAVAEKFSATDIQNDSISNIVGAKQKYCDKTLLISGSVRNIKEDHIELSSFYGANYMIDVFLSTEDLAKLQAGQLITVVGTTTDKIIEDAENVAEYTFNYSHYQMPVAYLVEDRVEITAIIKGQNHSYYPAYNIEVNKSNVLKLVYFAEDVDTSALTWNQEITFSAKAVTENDTTRYYDAQIIN